MIVNLKVMIIVYKIVVIDNHIAKTILQEKNL